jgi:hypothetical protein
VNATRKIEVRNVAGRWQVFIDGRSMADFTKHEDAWRCADRLDPDALAQEDARRRVQTAFAER